MDINGGKGPNKYRYDYFLFVFTLDNKVIPMGMEHKNNTAEQGMGYNFFTLGSNACSKNVGGWNSGNTCAYYALMDKHPKDSNKNYWDDFL